MSKKEAKSRIVQLSREIEGHNRQYYLDDDPSISDSEYDALLSELIRLEEKYPDLRLPDSPTQRVGVKLDSPNSPVTHAVKMLSLDNTYSIDELKAWHQRVIKASGVTSVEYCVELKIDGVSASLTYEQGLFTLGATRGDGVTGEDVTENLKTVEDIPLRLKGKQAKLPKRLDVRAEVYMAKEDFEAMNRAQLNKGLQPFANPRNATSGTVKLLDSRVTRERNLKCFVHSFGAVEGGEDFGSQAEFFRSARSMGLNINPEWKVCKGIDEVIAYCLEQEEKRNGLDYEVDGVVIKVNSLSIQKALGFTAKSPRWAVAFKFKAQQATTVIEEITIQVGRTGILTPVANLKPVACGGVTISRATLHNFDEIRRLKVNAGDKVLVERAGDVIPKIVKVVEGSGKAKPFRQPTKCPSCGEKVVKEKTEQVAVRCINPLCPDQQQKKVVHFASRGAMDIEGLGEAVVMQLLGTGLIKDCADIYSLTKDELLELDLFKVKRAEKLIKAIEASKIQPLSRLVFALGIANVGQKAAESLAERFGDLDRLSEATESELTGIDDVGEIMAVSIVQYFSQDQVKELLRKLKKAGVNTAQPKTAKASAKLNGQKFVFTGELSAFSRSEAGKLVKANGGEVVSSVSKKTDFVVAGTSPGSKYTKALDLGVRVLTESEFQEMIND